MNLFLIVSSLFGLYSQIPLVLGEVIIPNLFGLISGVALISANLKQIRKSELRAIFFILFIPCISILFSPNFLDFLPNRLLALAQMFVSIVAGYGLYLGLSTLSWHSANKIFKFFYMFIFIGVILETATPFQTIIKDFAFFIWGNSSDNQINRDLIIAGFVRPTFLTSEPSHLSKGIIVFLISAMILDPSPRKVLWVAILLVAGLAIIRSPTIIVGIPMIFVVFWFAHRNLSENLERRKKNIQMALLIILIGIPIIISIFFILEMRINEVRNGSDYSATIRLFTSINIGLESALLHPIAGVGIGGFDASKDLIIDILIDGGVPMPIAIEGWDKTLNNGIGTHILYYGFVLLPFYIFAFSYLLNLLSERNGIMVFLLMLCICFVTGSIYSPGFIIYYFIFSAASRISFQNILMKHRSAQNSDPILNPQYLKL